MKSLLKLSTLILVVLGFSATSFAQTISDAASASVTLITPLTITKDFNMDFGTISSSGTAGTIELGYDNSLTPTGGAKVVLATSAKAAQFTATGEPLKTFTISFPSEISLSKSGATSLLVALACDTASPGTLAVTTGIKVIKVKGTLTVPANTVAGTYTNNVDLKVTLNYQ